jgi:hypothetical protein
MADTTMSIIIRKRVIRGLIQAVILFGVFFGCSFFQSTEAGQAAFSRAAVFSILTVFGYSFNRVYHDLSKAKLARQYYNAGTALGMIIGALGFWQSMVSFNDFRVWPGKMALIFLSGITANALARAAAYRGKNEGGLWWGFLGWLENRPSVKFLFGIIIGLYFVYIRPYLSIDPNMMLVIEWFLFCILGLVILIRIWSGAERNIVNDEPGKTWQKHSPKIEKLTGTSHESMIRVERQFISIGEPAALYVLLVIMLDDNGVKESEIVSAAEPLMNFRGINQARQSSLILSRRARKQQKAMREEAVKQSFDRIAGMGNLNRVNSRGKSRAKVYQPAAEPGGEVAIDELKNRFLKSNDRAGFFTRIILHLHRNGRYHEHIVSALRNLTDDAGNPVEFAVKKVTVNSKQ